MTTALPQKQHTKHQTLHGYTSRPEIFWLSGSNHCCTADHQQYNTPQGSKHVMHYQLWLLCKHGLNSAT
jgi:hypothetical protein